MSEIRTEKTLGVNPKLRIEQKQRLARLIQTDTWTDLQDVLEFAVIRSESRLISADHTNASQVLGFHALAQAHWEAFSSLQNEVMVAAAEVNREKEKPREITEQDRVDALLDPTVLLDEEE